MIRFSLVLIFVSTACSLANAGDLLPGGQAGPFQRDGQCSALGEGFFPVAGSQACIKISGHISAGAGFGSASPNPWGPHFGGNSLNGGNAEAAAAADLRFNTPAGLARVYIGVRKDTNPAWAGDSQ